MLAPVTSTPRLKAEQTYYYVSTAVAGSGVESKFSNQLQAVIPSP